MQEVVRTWIFSSLQSPFVMSLQTRNYIALSGSGNLALILRLHVGCVTFCGLFHPQEMGLVCILDTVCKEYSLQR